MAFDIDWANLRTLNGSQRDAFEELCCQLASCEQVPEGSTFVRVGAPDAGVECYWVLPNGDEWGWQAKFFTSPPGPTQWQQITDSVQTALEKRPRLKRYTVCMPLDRADPRQPNKKSFMDEWNSNREKWERRAAKHGMSVEFCYWGQHEIIERLSREEHHGRALFWFNQHILSDTWFADHLDRVRADVGPRYTPELHIDLPISRYFDALGRTEQFFTRFNTLIDNLRKELPRHLPEPDAELYARIRSDIVEVKQLVMNEARTANPIQWETVVDRLRTWIDQLRKRHDELRSSSERTDHEPNVTSVRPTAGRHSDEARNYELIQLSNLIQIAYECLAFAWSENARLANGEPLLIVGEAGSGKTHLLCDIAQRRINDGLPTVMLLGQQFTESELWSQICRLLGLSCEKDDLLGALNAAGEARGHRTLIMIDALNESTPPHFWHKFLAGFLADTRDYPWIGVVLSVRSTVEEWVVPDHLLSDHVVRIVHHGFVGHEFDAVKSFFNYFDIALPQVPLLVPEFRNPLFLKLFCRGLSDSGYTHIPAGLDGVTGVFEFYLNSVNNRLSHPDRIGYPPSSNLVYRAVHALARKMLEERKRWLAHENAYELLASLHPSHSYERSLLHGLISEGVLAHDYFWVDEESSHQLGVRFAYERLADHILAQLILDDYINHPKRRESSAPGPLLREIVRDAAERGSHQGLVEALSVQVPERIGCELAALFPDYADAHSIRQGFIQSLVWRSPASMTEQTLQYTNEHVLSDDATADEFWEVVLTVATRPDHPFNADFLHQRLLKDDLPTRDAWWSIFLHWQSVEGSASPANRLVEWVWKNGHQITLPRDVARLASIALAWFLTTPNRFLRDRATKALVSLLTSRLDVLVEVLRMFFHVDDPYVTERLFAVAYGCAMMSKDRDGLRSLAEGVYNLVFESGAPPVNILLRDHARGLVERALTLGLVSGIDVNKVRPPYSSDWPDDMPGEEYVRTLLDETGRSYDQHPGFMAIYLSLLGFLDDFAKYVVRPCVSLWSSHPISADGVPSPELHVHRFVESLTARQREAWENLRWCAEQLTLLRRLETSNQVLQDERIVGEFEGELNVVEERFLKTLGKAKQGIYHTHVRDCVRTGRWLDQHLSPLPIQRWILRRVLELGWTEERFGAFDRQVRERYFGRHEDKPERMGKKYQWIALYEILARIADNYEFIGPSWREDYEPYQGAWQLSNIRNIDPSALVEGSASERGGSRTRSWWSAIECDDWDIPVDRVAWLQKPDDLPDIPSLLDLRHPQDGTCWLALHGYHVWEQPESPDQDQAGPCGREIWYILDAYVVCQEALNAMLSWALTHDHFSNRPPDPQDLHDYIYFGEIYWSPNYQNQYNEFYHYNVQVLVADDAPAPLTVTSETYSWPRGYDCSVNSTISAVVPSRYIRDLLDLEWNGCVGCFDDQNGNLAAFDPSVSTPGPNALLVRKDMLLSALNREGLALLWVVRGEKNDFGRGGWPDNFVGRLRINGAYALRPDGTIQGQLTTRFVSSDE